MANVPLYEAKQLTKGCGTCGIFVSDGKKPWRKTGSYIRAAFINVFFMYITFDFNNDSENIYNCLSNLKIKSRLIKLSIKSEMVTLKIYKLSEVTYEAKDLHTSKNIIPH